MISALMEGGYLLLTCKEEFEEHTVNMKNYREQTFHKVLTVMIGPRMSVGPHAVEDDL